MKKNQLISTAGAAKKLGFTQDWVRKLCIEGKIKAIKIGHDWIIDEKDLRDIKRVRITKKGQTI